MSQNTLTKPCTKKLSFKEEGEDFYSEGFVATDHPDRVGDIVPKNTLQKIVDSINAKNSIPQANAVSDRHDHIKQDNPNLPIAGMAVEAELKPIGNQNWGAWVKTHHNAKHPDFEDIKYSVEKGYYPGYSIEFIPTKTHPINVGEKELRVVDDLDFEGYGFASLRNIANPKAEITDYGYKEIMPKMAKIVEENKMVENKEEEAPKEEEETKAEEPAEEEEKVEEPAEEAEEKETKTNAKPEIKEVSERTVSEADYNRLVKLKEMEAAEIKKKEVNAAVRTELKTIMPEGTPLLNESGEVEGRAELKEITNYKKTIADYKEAMNKMYSKKDEGVRAQTHTTMVNHQWTDAKELLRTTTAKGVNVFSNNSGLVYKEQPFESVGNRIEMKELGRVEMKAGEGLQTDTNLADASWTYGSYYLSPVELNDIFQPVLINQLNDQTTTWGKLQKQSFAGFSQIQFRARTGRNSTAGGYSEGTNYTYASSFTGTVGRQKFQQPFCYYNVLVAVTGQEMAFAQAPGGMGDIWADELRWSAVDLQKKLNQEIISTGDGTSESACLGFEGLILGTTGTLYGKNIATAAYVTLKSHKENMSSARVTLDQLRKMVRFTMGGDSTVTNSNAQAGDLVFFCHPLQRDFIKGLLQDMQRLVPTSGRVGFEGEIEVDGIPVFGDVDMNTDDIFLIDMAHTKIGIKVPPTVEPLPITADARAAHIKTYFNLYSDAPSNNYWSYGFATS